MVFKSLSELSEIDRSQYVRACFNYFISHSPTLTFPTYFLIHVFVSQKCLFQLTWEYFVNNPQVPAPHKDVSHQRNGIKNGIPSDALNEDILIYDDEYKREEYIRQLSNYDCPCLSKNEIEKILGINFCIVCRKEYYFDCQKYTYTIRCGGASDDEKHNICQNCIGLFTFDDLSDVTCFVSECGKKYDPEKLKKILRRRKESQRQQNTSSGLSLSTSSSHHTHGGIGIGVIIPTAISSRSPAGPQAVTVAPTPGAVPPSSSIFASSSSSGSLAPASSITVSPTSVFTKTPLIVTSSSLSSSLSSSSSSSSLRSSVSSSSSSCALFTSFSSSSSSLSSSSSHSSVSIYQPQIRGAVNEVILKAKQILTNPETAKSSIGNVFSSTCPLCLSICFHNKKDHYFKCISPPCSVCFYIVDKVSAFDVGSFQPLTSTAFVTRLATADGQHMLGTNNGETAVCPRCECLAEISSAATTTSDKKNVSASQRDLRKTCTNMKCKTVYRMNDEGKWVVQ